MPASWTLALVDSIGRPLTEGGLLAHAQDVRILRQRTGAQIVSMLLPATSPDAIAILGAQDPYIKAYRTLEGGTIDDRTLRFYGSVWVDELTSDGDVDMLLVTAIDQLAILDKRYTAGQFVPTDLGLLIKSMIDTTNTNDGDTGIETNVGRITASSSLDMDLRTIRPTIGSIIQQFSSMLDGVETWLVPIELAGTKHSQLYVAPRRGQNRTNIVFGYGQGSINNCRLSRVRDKSLVENDARGYSETLSATRTNPTSIAALGRLVGYTSFTGVTTQAVMNARTQGRLDQRSTRDKVAAYSARPTRSAPIPFDEFDVGDTVKLDYRRGVEWIATARVDTITIVVNRAGEEILDAITFRNIT